MSASEAKMTVVPAAHPISENVQAAYPTQVIPLKLLKVDTSFNSRVGMNSQEEKRKIAELAASLDQNGQLQPVLVRPVKGGNYFLIAGFRRTAALKLLGKETINASIVPEKMPDTEAKILNCAENFHRKDLTTFEKAQAFANLEVLGIKRAEMDARLGLDMARSTVGNYVRVFTKLDPSIKKMWADPDHKLQPILTLPNLLDIIGKEDQNKRLLELQGHYTPEEEGGEGSSEEGTTGDGQRTGKKTVLPRNKILKAIEAMGEIKGLNSNIREGAMAAFDFVLRNKETFRLEGKLVFNPKAKPVKEEKEE